MKNLYTKFCRAVLDQYENRENEQEIKGDNFNQLTQRCTFRPGLTVTDQLQKFEKQIQKGLWNQEISIKGYKGTFKIENWIYIEQKLRQLQNFTLIQFIDTQLDKEHLNVLNRLINWVNPQDFSIILKQNEVDDQDVKEFIEDLITNQINFQKIIIKSNPGIYKGHFLENLEQDLQNEELFNRRNYYYQLVKNEQIYSIGIIKILKNLNNDEKEQTIKSAKAEINQTSFFDLNLSSCFTNENFQGLYYLLEQLYHEDHLEQLVGLNISDNNLGEIGSFSKACQLMSTSKGLLKLDISNQPLIHNSVGVEGLCGNRYDQLRLSHFRVGRNDKMTPKAFEFLCNNIVARSLKTFSIDSSLPAELPTLLKIFYIIEAYDKEITSLRNLLRTENRLHKLNLEELDLSTVENYNRHDLMYKLIKNTVFNEFSSVKKLTISNCDAGRMEAYYKAYKDFCKHINNQNSIHYKDFRLPLKEIVIPEQRYSMTTEINQEFLLTLVFTTTTDILQIQSVKFIESNNVQPRNDAFKEALIQISQENNEKTYSLKHFEAKSMIYYFELSDFKALLCNPSLQLETFTIEETSCALDADQFFEILSPHIQSIETNNQFYSLKSLNLKSAYGTSLELYSIISLLIMNDRAQLRELRLTGMQIILNEKQQQILDQLIIRDQKIKELKILEIGNLEGENIYEQFFKYLILNKWIRLQELTMVSVPIEKLLATAIDPNIDVNQQDHQLSQLKKIKLQQIHLDTEAQWKVFSSIFMFNKYSTLQSLHFEQIPITQDMQLGLESTLLSMFTSGQNVRDYPKLQQLTFVTCEIQTEFLILYFFNPFCRITDYSVHNCDNFDKFLLQTKQIALAENIQETMTCQLTSFSSNFVQYSDGFEWFFSNIVFNEKKQKMVTLKLTNCSLQDKQIQQLADIITKLKQTEQKQKIKRYFRLREINLSENSEISTEKWKSLFDVILDVADKSEEKNDTIDQQIQQNEDQSQLQQKIEENNQLVTKSNLNLQDKILNFPNVFQFLPPQNLQHLELDMNFQYLGEDDKNQTYKSIIQGLIVHQESQLRRLKLSSLDMERFMRNFEEYFQFAQLHQKNWNINSPFHLKLEDIEIAGLQTQDEQSTKQFIKYFVCSEYIDLTRLVLTEFSTGVIKELLEQSPQKGQYKLKELRVPSVYEQLNKDQSIQFIKYMFFGERFPIEILEVGENVGFEGKLHPIDYLGKESFEGEIKLKSLTIFNGGYDIDKIETIDFLLNEILLNPATNLDLLQINGLNHECRCFDTFYSKSLSKVSKLNITKLQIENTIEINADFLSLLDKTRGTLKELKLSNITSYALTEEALKSYKGNQSKALDCQLQVDKFTSEDVIMLQQYFCFNKELNFSRVIHNDLDAFNSNLDIGNGFERIRYLRFSFNLYYNDQSQLDETSLSLIGKHFIYNKQSCLEELTFHQCHLKPPGIKALTQDADKFRKEVESDKEQSTTKLSLKRFNIYYSLYIGDDGAEIINKDILFFEYIGIERIEVEVTNWNSENQISMCKSALNWLEFQKQHRREYMNYLPLKHFDIGRNEFVATEEAWKLTCSTFLFTNLTPKMEIVNIHFMALTDASTEMITQFARTYFNSKSSGYKYQVKRLSFSHNGSLTHKGWLDVSKNLFFHPKVELEELNISDTNLDNEMKINNIVNSAIAKAQTRPNKKLTLHTLITYNTVVKQKLEQYLSDQPSNYSPPDDLPVDIDYAAMKNVGYFGGTPEEFGQYNQCQNNLMYNQKHFITSEWIEKAIVKQPLYHLSIANNYIKPLNEFYVQQKLPKATVYFNLSTLDLFCNIFRYTTKEPGSPYPYTLLFQEETFQQFKQSSSILQNVILINAKTPELEKVTYQFIIFLWENIKQRQSSIDQITLDYYLDDDLIDCMFAKGYTEGDIVQLIRLIPPSKIRVQNTLSLQAIKALYSIFYDTQHFQYSQIQFDFDNFLNIGIGYALREVAYNMKARGLKKYFKYQLYKVCDFFVKDTLQYKFNSEITDLNKYLSTKHFYFYSIAFTNILFMAICVLSPYFFSHYYETDNDSIKRSQFCIQGPSKIANYMYYCFAVITLLVEAYVYKNITQYVPSFISKLEIKVAPKEDDEDGDEKAQIGIKIEEAPNNLSPIKQQPKKKSILKSTQTQIDRFTQSSYGYWINFTMTMVTSQLAKYDFFNDICFLLTCYYCDEVVIFWLALAVLIFNWSIKILSFTGLVLKKIFLTDERLKQLSTAVINDFYKVSIIGRNFALTNLLDQVAPFNVDIIPNNFITRYIFPHQAGKAINSSIKGYLLQFLFEDLPQILLLLVFLIRQALKNGGIKWNLIVTVVTSSVTVLMSFHKFMSIRPSYLSQEHFDKLSNKKQKEHQQYNLKLLEQEAEQLVTYADLYNKSDSENNRLNESRQLL